MSESKEEKTFFEKTSAPGDDSDFQIPADISVRENNWSSDILLSDGNRENEPEAFPVHEETETAMNAKNDVPEAEKPKSLKDVYVTKPASRRGLRFVIIIGMAAILLFSAMRIPAVGNWVNNLFFSRDDSTVMFSQVNRGVFIHEITVRGDVSSSSNVTIKCNVANPGGTMLLEVIPEGTYVKKGEKLVVLDSTTFDDQINTQEITVSNSQASFESAKNSLKSAEIAKKEYLEGSYEVSLAKYESSIISATEERDRLKEYLEHSKKLYEKGFSTKSQLRADEFALENAEIKLKIAEQEMKVLTEYTKVRNLIQYDNDINTAKANVLAKERAYELEQQKLTDLRQRKENCTILSPEDGQVVYANETGGQAGSEFIVQEGVMVRERQTILLLPDPSRLQVTADVKEGSINYIKVGMPVTLRLDALQTQKEPITGVVMKVNEFPQPTNFWMGNIKEYRVTIKLNPREGLRPGMTADTRILVDKQEDVLQVPTHCVFEWGGANYAITYKNGVWDKREVKLDATNYKTVIILPEGKEDDLKEGDLLVCNAFMHRDKVSLPPLPAGHTSSAVIPSAPGDLDAAKSEAKGLQEKFQAQEVLEKQDRQKRAAEGGMGFPGGDGPPGEGRQRSGDGGGRRNGGGSGRGGP